MIATESDLVLDGPTRELCAAVASGRLAPARLAMIAPGGYGKTAVLDHLATICAQSGLAVARFGEHDERSEIVLVDDAHDLDPEGLAELAKLAADEQTGLVIAARTRPRPRELSEVLARLNGQVVLRPLDPHRIALVLGQARTERAEWVHTETGGVPLFVSRLAKVLDSEAEVPVEALAEFRQEFDRASPETLLVLLAAEAGAGLDAPLLVGLLGLNRPGRGGQDRLTEIVDTARATGLLAGDGSLTPIVRRALRNFIPAGRRLAVYQRLVRLQLERRGPVLPLVGPLLDNGLTGAEPAAAFETAATEAADGDPALASRLYAAAVNAGRPVNAVGTAWAEVAARAGDLDTALRVADQVITSAEGTDRRAAAGIAGTALVHRGQLARSAELFRWSGTRLSTVYGALGLLGTGAKDEASALLAGPSGDEPPTLLSGAMSAAAQAVLDSITGPPTSALSTLVSSAETLEPVGRSALLPDSPAALGALVGVHAGELGVAETLLERAIASSSGGEALVARHRLLLAWAAMTRGNTDVATEHLGAVVAFGRSLAPRDWLFAIGLRAGLARRTSDLAGLRAAWDEAYDAVIRHPVDLFTLLPFAELTVAAAQIGDAGRLAPQQLQARELLRRLGDPPLWTTPWHWSCLHAAITTEQLERASEHAEALAANAGHSPYHTMLAEAADCWLHVVGGDGSTVDARRVETAAKRLHTAGLWWDGARLAGQAAIRTKDRDAMVALLECARVLRGRSPVGVADPGTEAKPTLSERERQVAELVVAGMTYKQVGDQLFISAKTVEHHMARMRQRLGATSRNDLLTQLRELTKDP